MTEEAAHGVVRTRVVYTGHVQGVGFRYTTRTLAEGFAVTGYVRNCPDGTVEMEVQGPVGEVDGLLAAIAAEFAGHIRSAPRHTLPPDPGEGDFRIAH